MLIIKCDQREDGYIWCCCCMHSRTIFGNVQWNGGISYGECTWVKYCRMNSKLGQGYEYTPICNAGSTVLLLLLILTGSAGRPVGGPLPWPQEALLICMLGWLQQSQLESYHFFGFGQEINGAVVQPHQQATQP